MSQSYKTQNTYSLATHSIALRIYELHHPEKNDLPSKQSPKDVASGQV
jgi:dihydrodipicolinate reductase